MTFYSLNNLTPMVHDSTFIAPDADIIGNVRINEKSSVWFKTVIRGDFEKIRIGRETNIQDLCMCHADEGIPLHIGNGVTIGHRCVIHGCTIEDECLIGMGAVIMNRAVIGKGSIVAAGSVVLEKTVIPPYSLVTGSPGRVKKTYENKEQIIKNIKTMSGEYRRMAQYYKAPETFFEKLHSG